jgi:Mrp family chromosome partitioning ATPase
MAKKIKTLPEPPLLLDVRTYGGDLILGFPMEVIDSLRKMITEISHKEESGEKELYNESFFGRSRNFPASFAMISTLRGEGVTYMTWALAATLVNDYGAKACVVDLNWWWPFTAKITPENNPGIAGVLNEGIALDDVLVATANPNLAFLPAGSMDRRERPIHARGSGLKKIMTDLGSRFDHLILDIPAIRATHDAVPLAMLSEACGVVVRHGVTRIDEVQLALDEIDHLNILGVVMNQVKYSSPNWLLKIFPQA